MRVIGLLAGWLVSIAGTTAAQSLPKPPTLKVSFEVESVSGATVSATTITQRANVSIRVNSTTRYSLSVTLTPEMVAWMAKNHARVFVVKDSGGEAEVSGTASVEVRRGGQAGMGQTTIVNLRIESRPPQVDGLPKAVFTAHVAPM